MREENRLRLRLLKVETARSYRTMITYSEYKPRSERFISTGFVARERDWLRE